MYTSLFALLKYAQILVWKFVKQFAKFEDREIRKAKKALLYGIGIGFGQCYANRPIFERGWGWGWGWGSLRAFIAANQSCSGGLGIV